MVRNGISVKENDYWRKKTSPVFSIITPLYNRRNTIKRTMLSVQNQVYKGLEYIIIDDGSSDNCDDIILDFMENVDFPVLFISKPNGGVHTARNIGYEYARGELVICIDSDDELLPDACKIFYEAWKEISHDQKQQYWQLKALCVDSNGSIISPMFPEKINEMTKDDAFKFFSFSNGEQLGCRVLSIMKQNKFPEPQYVKFVNECVIWTKLEKEYKSYGINKPVRIYHTEGDDRLCVGNNKSMQSCVNALWNSAYAINNPTQMVRNIKEYLIYTFRYEIMKNILQSVNHPILQSVKLTTTSGLIVSILISVPAKLGSYIYKKRRMK